jgi:hypothetical protein
LKKTASYQNGLIEDSGTFTIATMSIVLPVQGPFSVRLEWDVPASSTVSARVINF